jgi:dihydrolipoamide dehydrogenase
MASNFTVTVPDIGDFEEVAVIEILVAPGQRIEAEASVVTLESDKATMEIPSPRAGVVEAVLVAVNDTVSEGTPLVRLALEDVDVAAPAREAAPEDDAAPTRKPASSDDVAPTAETVGDEVAANATSARGSADADHAEVLVLGAGPGGYTAAFRAADLGKHVVLVERDPVLGGVCLNAGCIPSKVLLHLAEVIHETEGLAAAGVSFDAPRLDFAKIHAHVDRVVSRLNQGLAKLADQRGVRVLTGSGRFIGPNRVEVETESGSHALSFDAAIVAVGSRPATLPGMPDDPRVLDSTSALRVDPEARRLLVVGGGIIGLEMAAVYDALGAEVTVVELLPQLMPGTDPDLVRPLARSIARRYAGVHLETRVTGVEATDEGLLVHLEGGKAPDAAVYDRVLVAIGRVPNGDRIDLERAGVQVDERGFVPTDDRLRTNVPHIYAIGDVTGSPMLAHKATHEGAIAAESICGLPSAFDAAIPSVAYTDPEIAWVGLTEAEARERGLAVEKSVFPWVASGRALGIGRTEGSTKLLFDAESGRLRGAGIVGPSAGELIAEATLAIELGANAEDLALTIHPHPTLSETLGFAAQIAAGTITDLYLPKKRADS